MSRKCAYCGSDTKLSKEHVWPKSFLAKLEKGYAKYSPKSGKVHGGDYIVHDVCSLCNNERLSPLDLYFSKLYDSYFYDTKGLNETIIFEFDYDLLTRVLLKIAYNTARSAGSEVLPFQRIVNYILYGTERPEGIATIAELVSPTFITHQINKELHIKEIRPTMFRSALGKLLTPHGDTVLVRIVAVNSFYFHLLITRDPFDKKIFEIAVNEFTEGIPGTILLSPTCKSVSLYSSPQDGISSMLPLLKGKHKEYSEFFNKPSKK